MARGGFRSGSASPLALAAMGAIAAGCGSDGGTLALEFEHRIDGEALALEEVYTTRYGQEVSFDHVRYWVSNVSLRRGDDVYEVPASYYLVEQTPEHTRTVVEIGGIPAGTYDGLILHIGVDAGPNGSLDLMAGELEPGIGMDWSWDTGYKFFRTEGDFVERGVEGRFVVHTGNDVLYKRLSGEFPEPIEIRSGAPAQVFLRAELDRIFAGLELSENIVQDNTTSVQGGTVDSLAGKVAGNYARMFTLETSAGRARLSASSPNVGGGEDDGEIPTDGTPPALTAPLVDVPGSLWCEEVPSRPSEAERACTTPFLLDPGGGDYRDAGFFTLVTDNGAPVEAASPGLVSEVLFLEHSTLTHSDLFAVTVRPNEDSAFFVEYRNLKNLRVDEGQELAAGDVLGGAGDHFDAAVGAVSFGVRRQQELVQRLCPTRYMDGELTAVFEEALATSSQAWPEITHDALCQTASLVCAGDRCEGPGDFSPAGGDVDAGRRIFRSSCASCHGEGGEGNIGPKLCSGAECPCDDCGDHETLATRIEEDMPPEGHCDAECAANVAAYILHAF